MSGKYWVKTDNAVIECFARHKIKDDGIILAGDNVDIDFETKIITNIHPRKNKLMRPPVANIDQMIIVISSLPQADFYLADKLIIAAKINRITPILCFNKTDLNEELALNMENQYQNSDVPFLKVSAKSRQNLDMLIKIMAGKINCFAGQSAVGKSSLINALLGYEYLLAGELSQKINRGKNTTRHTELISIDNFCVVDTPGFSLLELKDLMYNDLKDYYAEFEPFKNDCRFSSCTHTVEPSCKVRQAAIEGLFSFERYKRYTEIFAGLKKEQDNFYN